MYRPLEIRLKNFISYDTLVYKFPERPVLLMGENKDDSSQKGNGSGKSALIEAIPLAILGETLRNVKVKELIRRGADSAEIEIDLYNKKLGKVLSIKRTLFLKKSSKVEVKFGTQEIRLSSVSEYDAYILKILQISKEDFFSFFVIKKDDYKPFFSTTDSKKKAIINRFSKADIIDKTKPLIDQELLVLDHKLREKEKELAYHTGQINVLLEQLSQKSPAKRIEDLKMQLQYSKEREHKCRQFKIESIEIKQRNSETMSLYNTDIENNKKSILHVLGVIENERKEYKVLLDQYNLKNTTLQEIFTGQSLERNKVQDQIFTLSQEIGENKVFQSQLEGQIKEGIECPVCHHLFSLRDKDFDVNEAKAILSEELIPFIQSLQNQIKNLDFDIVSIQNTHKANNAQFEKELYEMNAQLFIVTERGKQSVTHKSNLETELDLLNLKQARLQNLIDDNLKDDLKAEQELIKISTEVTSLLGQITTIENEQNKDEDQIKIDKLNEDISKINIQIENHKTEIVAEKVWITHFKNFKSFLANQSIGNITSYTNMYLEKMDSNLSVEIDGYRTLASDVLKEEISVTVYKNLNESGSYGCFSAGERARIDIACIMSIQHLINLSCNTGGLDLLVCDEILDAADSYGIQKIIESISDSSAVIMIVSQNDVISSIANIVTATKEKGVTSLSYNF